jgi:predicted patatin/cPLA2 family phospholipase
MSKSISFVGGGYLCIYQLGCVKYLLENKHLIEDYKFLGSSCGAIIATLLLLDIEYEKIEKLLYNHCNKFYNISLFQSPIYSIFKITDIFNYLNKLIPDNDELIKQKLNNKLYVSTTKLYGLKNIMKTEFNSKKELLEILNVGASIPFIQDNKFRKINNEYFIDGGITNNSPIIDENTIIIDNNKTSSNKCFKCSIDDNWFTRIFGFLIVPNNERIKYLINTGYNDIKNYFDQINAEPSNAESNDESNDKPSNDESNDKPSNTESNDKPSNTESNDKPSDTESNDKPSNDKPSDTESNTESNDESNTESNDESNTESNVESILVASTNDNKNDIIFELAYESDSESDSESIKEDHTYIFDEPLYSSLMKIL